jgi:hypothetical protein
MGKPTPLNGEMVIFWDLGCRIHNTALSVQKKPQSVETVVGNWEGRERITK